MDNRQPVIALLLTLVLLIVQLAGLHFHLRQLVSSPDSSVPAVVHAAHVGEHTACHGDTCGTDVPIAKFWKNPDQGWNLLALLITVFALLLPATGRVIGHIPPDQSTTPFDRSVFLRPPLRAPPR